MHYSTIPRALVFVCGIKVLENSSALKRSVHHIIRFSIKSFPTSGKIHVAHDDRGVERFFSSLKTAKSLSASRQALRLAYRLFWMIAETSLGNQRRSLIKGRAVASRNDFARIVRMKKLGPGGIELPEDKRKKNKQTLAAPFTGRGTFRVSSCGVLVSRGKKKKNVGGDVACSETR